MNSIFESIDEAKDLWTQMKLIENIFRKKIRKLIHHDNGSMKRPMNHSVLIYPKENEMPFGYVTVIHQFLTKSIRIGDGIAKYRSIKMIQRAKIDAVEAQTSVTSHT